MTCTIHCYCSAVQYGAVLWCMVVLRMRKHCTAGTNFNSHASLHSECMSEWQGSCSQYCSVYCDYTTACRQLWHECLCNNIHVREKEREREREGEGEVIVYRCCCVISCFCLVQLVSGQTEPGRCVYILASLCIHTHTHTNLWINLEFGMSSFPSL